MTDPKSSLPPTSPPTSDDDQPRGLARRDFLKISSTAAAAAAAAVAAPALGRADVKLQPPAPRPKGAAKDLKGGWFVV